DDVPDEALRARPHGADQPGSRRPSGAQPGAERRSDLGELLGCRARIVVELLLRDPAVAIPVDDDVVRAETPPGVRPIEVDADEGGSTAGHDQALDGAVLDLLAAPDGVGDEPEGVVDALDAPGPAEEPHGGAQVEDVGMVERSDEAQVARRKGARE